MLPTRARRLRDWMATFALCALLATAARAFPTDYGPFAAGQSPPRFPVQRCAQLARDGPPGYFRPRAIIYGSDRRTDPRLRAIAVDTDRETGTRIEIVDADGRALAGPSLASLPPDGRPESVFCADLNGDARLDFVLPLWGHGNGLGALFYELVVALSSGSTYRLWLVSTAQPGPEDLLRLDGNAGVVIVKSSFRNNQAPDERHRHSYWIYNLIAVRDDELVLANELDARFPKWVWYTIRPNHSPATSLSPADQERIWNLEPEPLFREAPAAGP